MPTLRPSNFKIFVFKKFNSTKRQSIIASTKYNIYYTHAIILTIKHNFYQTLFEQYV